MSERNNDRIEQFFKKVAARADITFNEEDWKKLEARLDAADALKSAGPNKAGKITGVAIISALLIATTVWLSANYDFQYSGERNGSAEIVTPSGIQPQTPVAPQVDPGESTDGISSPERDRVAENADASKEIEFRRRAGEASGKHGNLNSGPKAVEKFTRDSVKDASPVNDGILLSRSHSETYFADLPVKLSDEEIHRDLVRTLPASTERNKQKAVVELPGAEEEQTREVDATVEEEHASDQTKLVATPRLSLLLSFAPDFSGTSMEFYSAPGKAYGAMLHYHPFPRWSIAAGVVKNHKVYTGDGAEYNPPKGYWKYYTNGVIPETVDGSCSILEFPITVQYTLHNSGKHKWLAGLGASSYLMQSESYRYKFGSPNPGAKEGWDSKRSSHFMFNMVNLSIGYERRILPGLMLGVEPYAKIPLEEIGWSNLRLFSTGASVTLRYMILQKKTLTLPQGRAPD